MEHLIAAAMAGVNMMDADNDYFDYYSMTAEEGKNDDVPLSEDADSEGEDDVTNNYSDRHHDIPQDRPPGASMTTRASLSAATSSPSDVIAASWQSTFKQIRDFHDLGHRHYPPRLAAWLDAQRRRYVAYGTGRIAPIGIVGNRIRQLDSIGIDWIGRTGNKVKVQNRSSYEVHEDDDTDDDVSVPMPPPPGRASTKNNKGRNRGATNTPSQGRSSGLLVASVKLAGGASAHLQPWTITEDEAIGKLRKHFGGNKWSKIARTFDNGRTDSEIKNRWATLERLKSRRLRHKGMDEEDDDDVQDEDEETEETGEDDDSSVNDDQDPTDKVHGLVRAALESERRKSLTKPSRASTRLPPRNESTASSAVKRPFPETLFLLVNEIGSSKPHVLSWVNAGKAFEVRDPDLLSPLLSRYFRHNNYSSLARMLQMYGFTKTNITSTKSIFQHPHFTRSSRVESIVLRVTRDMVAAKTSSEDPSPTSSSREKTMRTLSKPAEAWRPRPDGSRESSRLSSTKQNDSKGVSDPKFLFDIKGGRRPPLSRSSPDNKNIKKEDDDKDYSGNDPLVGATIFVHSGKFQGRKGELVDRRERGWSTIKGIPKRVQVQFFAVVDDGKVDLNAARAMSRSMPRVMTTSQVAKALEGLDGDEEEEEEEDALESTPDKKKRSDHLVGATVYVTQGAFMGHQGTLEARGERGWCNISGIPKRIKINSFSIVNDGKIDLKAARAMRLYTPPVMTPAQVTKALASIELDDEEEEEDDDDNEEQGNTSDPAIKKERPVDHLVGATVYVTHGKFRGQTGALEKRGDRGWCNISGIPKRIKINSFSVVNDGKFDLKAARAMPRFMPPVMTPAQVSKALESIELGDDDDEDEEDDDNDNGTPGSNSKSTRVDSVDHLVGATIYIDTGVFKGQSGTLVDRRERGWCTITGIERRVQVTYFVVVDDGKVDLDAARAMSRSMPRVWSTEEVAKARERLNGKILSMEQSEEILPEEIDGDDSDDSGDPPFRKAGHPHLGKRVRHFLQPGGSEGDYVDGTVTGYLSPNDVDSKGNPAFTSTHTKRPAALFRVTFDANNRAQLKCKDMEMSEVEEALRANSSTKVELVPPDADTSPGEYPNWNLGKQSKVPGVQYFKSDIGEYWIEQVVPRKNHPEGRCDTYYLNPDGLRFRSIKEVHRFLEDGDDNEQEIFAPKKDYDSSDDGEVEEMDIAPNDDDVASLASSSEQEESKPEGGEEGSLNPCSCKKSKCLKLYCECFNKGLYCTSDCYCTDCRNKPSNATQRDAAIADILARNKDAFKPRIKTTIECRCKRSACLKKYCDCYNHGVFCSEICRCKGCENIDPDKPDKKKKAKLEPKSSTSAASAQTSQYDDMYRSDSSIDANYLAAVPYQKNGVVFESSVNVKSEWQPKKSYAALKNDADEDKSSYNAQDASDLIQLGTKSTALGITWNDVKGGKTLRCPKCMKDFQFSCAKTAGASFSRHVRICEGGTSEKDLELQKSRERKKIARSSNNDSMTVGKQFPPSMNIQTEKPIMNPKASTDDDDLSARITTSLNNGEDINTFKCPHCVKDFTYPNKKTAKASFANHIRWCVGG